MSQPRLRSPPRIAPQQDCDSAVSSPPDSSPMASGSAASPSKVRPHLTPLLPPTCSRSSSLPSYQSPHRRGRSITPPPRSHGSQGSGLATPPHRAWQTVKKRKWSHLTPDMSQLGASPPFTSRNRFYELSHLSDDDMHGSDKISLPRQVPPAPSSFRNTSRPPYMYTA
jgi:hypothetical protein